MSGKSWLNVYAILLGLSGKLADVAFANAEKIDWNVEIEKAEDLFIKELKTRDFLRLDHKLRTRDFVSIIADSVILGDFEALEKLDKARLNIHGYKEGPAHVTSTCGNTALVWRRRSFIDDHGMTKNGTYVVLFVYQDGMAKIKLSHATV